MNSLVYVCLLMCSNIPNRSTFACPFCGARNLDQQELVKHCMDNHRNDPNKVVRSKQTRRKVFDPEADEGLLSQQNQKIESAVTCLHIKQ